MFKTQTGIQSFFRVLSEDEVRTLQTKRKRADSGEEVDPVARWKRGQERKLVHKRERNRINQQTHREKLKDIEIRDGI